MQINCCAQGGHEILEKNIYIQIRNEITRIKVFLNPFIHIFDIYSYFMANIASSFYGTISIPLFY